VYENGDFLTTGGLGELLDKVPQLPAVWLSLPDERVQAVLLVWGHQQHGGWVAGVAYLQRSWHARALVTMWAPARWVSPHPRGDYRQVPRVRLPGDPGRWPTLPPRYPSATGEWIAAHRHTVYPGAG
jgi:hypothetical protein